MAEEDLLTQVPAREEEALQDQEIMAAAQEEADQIQVRALQEEDLQQ